MRLPKPPEDDVLPAFATFIFVAIVALFAFRNLPWHLDDLDQAKQAYVSYQIVNDGSWVVQNTPTGDIATKPPLQGWLSAWAYLGVGGHLWDFAWRLPAFGAALLILWQLWRTGETLFGNNIGAVLAAGAFGLNSYVPRLATLVRTDMMLAAFIFFVGWIILEKLRTEEEWTLKDRILLFLLLLGSMLTKGPIAFGFLLPGLVAYHFLSRKWGIKSETPAFCGLIWWAIPLAIFGAWLAVGITQPGFKEQVIDKEFLGRFTFGKSAVHNTGYPGTYTVLLLIRTLPWSLMLVALLFVNAVRREVKSNPVLLWLACWTAGGLLFMELVPSKRFDRILPVLPPMCLFIAAASRYLPRHEVWKQPIGRLAILLPMLGLLFAGGYAGLQVSKNYAEHADVLVKFGEQVRAEVQGQGDRLAVVNGKDEGMLMYTNALKFTRLDDALVTWKAKKIDWVVMSERDFNESRDALRPYDVIGQTPPVADKFSSYRFLRRVNPPPQPPPVSTVKGNGPPRPDPRTAPPTGAPAWQPPTKLE
jgi:4-amino-4-deoxy-L-arabinose transferase-like glycosyltransferase